MKKKSLIITTATFCMASFVSLHGQTTIDTVRGMPITSDNNGVDFVAGAGDLSSYTAFTARVTSAFDNNTGGTMTAGSVGAPTEIIANFGQDFSRSVSLTTKTEDFTTVTSGSFEPFHTKAFSDATNSATFGFSIGPIVDNNTSTPLAGWGVTEFGFTVLSRTNAVYPIDLRVTATFSDLTTVSLLSSISNVAGEGDTFYHFEAPEGTFITDIDTQSLVSGTQTGALTRIGFDNIGFVAVPEPHTYALFAGLLGLVCVSLRRRMRA